MAASGSDADQRHRAFCPDFKAAPSHAGELTLN
jgi:hypothetical protein